MGLRGGFAGWEGWVGETLEQPQPSAGEGEAVRRPPRAQGIAGIAQRPRAEGYDRWDLALAVWPCGAGFWRGDISRMG